MPTAIDLFDKARRHERLEQLQAARDHDLMPYFRVLEGPAGPVVEMEGSRRIMLGSNNYLGLTGDPRVKDAARTALERFGTGLTGSRFLNGTLSLHLELERMLADWMGTEDALVFTTGYLANTGAIGTLLGPGDTVGLRLRRPRLDPRRRHYVARADPALPPQPARQARDDAEARRERRRRSARRGRRRVLDGGRPRAEFDIVALCRARRA